MFDWLRHKLGFLTYREIEEFRKQMELPESIKKLHRLTSEPYEHVLNVALGQWPDKEDREKMLFGLRSLYKSSDFFAGLVNNSILWAEGRSNHSVGRFKQLAFERIILVSCDKESEIRASVASKDAEMGRALGPLIQSWLIRLRHVELSEGYSINELWNEFFAGLRRVRQNLNY